MSASFYTWHEPFENPASLAAAQHETMTMGQPQYQLNTTTAQVFEHPTDQEDNWTQPIIEHSELEFKS